MWMSERVSAAIDKTIMAELKRATLRKYGKLRGALAYELDAAITSRTALLNSESTTTG